MAPQGAGFASGCAPRTESGSAPCRTASGLRGGEQGAGSTSPGMRTPGGELSVGSIRHRPGSFFTSPTNPGFKELSGAGIAAAALSSAAAPRSQGFPGGQRIAPRSFCLKKQRGAPASAPRGGSWTRGAAAEAVQAARNELSGLESPAQAVQSKAKPRPAPAPEDSPKTSGWLAGELPPRSSTKALFCSWLDSPELPEAQISPPQPRGRQLLPPGLLLHGAWTSAAASWTPGAAPTAAAPSKNARRAELEPGDELRACPCASRPAVAAAWLPRSSRLSAEGARSSSSCSKPPRSASPAPEPAVGTPRCVLGAVGTELLSPTAAGLASCGKVMLVFSAPGVAKAPQGSCSTPTLGAASPESLQEAAPVPNRAGIVFPSRGRAEAAGMGSGPSPGTPKSLGHAKFTSCCSASASPLPENANPEVPTPVLPCPEPSSSASPSSTSSSSISGRAEGSCDALPSPPSPSGFALLGFEDVEREAPLSGCSPGPCGVLWGAGLKFRARLRGFSLPSTAGGVEAALEGLGVLEASFCPSRSSST